MDLTNAVDNTHDQLVNVSPDKQADFLAESNLDNWPYKLTDFIIDVELRTQILNGLSSNLEDSVEEDFQWPLLFLLLLLDPFHLLHGLSL